MKNPLTSLLRSLCKRFCSPGARVGAGPDAVGDPRLKNHSTFCLTLLAFLTLALPLPGQNPNPVPFVHQPLVPTAVVPGGPDFTLTVNGAGFVPGAVVHWNGSPRPTTFVSNTQLTAAEHARVLNSQI